MAADDDDYDLKNIRIGDRDFWTQQKELAQEMAGEADLLTMSLTGDAVTEDLLVTEFNEGVAALSHDGQWFAYQSDASGVFEVYVRPFPDADSGLHQISTNGGRSPLWAPDGSELFYVDDNGRLLAVPVQTEATFSRATPTVVVDGGYLLSSPTGRGYDIDPSGARFLLIKPRGGPGTDSLAPPSITFVLNWAEELKNQVPVE